MVDARTTLVDAGFIAPFEYAPGFPGLLPPAVRAVERMRHIYRSTLQSRMAVESFTNTPLFDVEEYRAWYGASFDYSNVYELEMGDRSYVIRPDSLAQMIHRGAHGVGDATLICDDPIFRAETTDPKPLIRDKHLWGVTQAVHQVIDGSLETAWHAQNDALYALFDTALLPTLFVDAGPLREHAKRRILTFTVTSDGKTWLTSTLYELARQFTDSLGANGPVIELGYTAKLLALEAALHVDTHGMRIPSYLAPHQVGVSSMGETTSIEQELAAAEIRVERTKSRINDAVRKARRAGLPLVVQDGGETNRVFSRVGNESTSLDASDPVEHVKALLREHDAQLWNQAVQAQDCLFDRGSEQDSWVRTPTDDTDSDEYVLGTIVDANYPAGKRAAEQNAVLVSAKRRFY